MCKCVIGELGEKDTQEARSCPVLVTTPKCVGMSSFSPDLNSTIQGKKLARLSPSSSASAPIVKCERTKSVMFSDLLELDNVDESQPESILPLPGAKLASGPFPSLLCSSSALPSFLFQPLRSNYVTYARSGRLTDRRGETMMPFLQYLSGRIRRDLRPIWHPVMARLTWVAVTDLLCRVNPT